MVAQSEQSQVVKRKYAVRKKKKSTAWVYPQETREKIHQWYVVDGLMSGAIAKKLNTLPDRISSYIVKEGLKADRAAYVARIRAGLADDEAKSVLQANRMHRDVAASLSFDAMDYAVKRFSEGASAQTHAAIANAAEKWVKIFRQAAGLQNAGEVNVTQVNQTTLFLGGTPAQRATTPISALPSTLEAEIVPDKPTDIGASPIS